MILEIKRSVCFFLSYNSKLRGRGEVWSSRLPVTQEVAGSNPVVPAIRPDSSVGRALV